MPTATCTAWFDSVPAADERTTPPPVGRKFVGRVTRPEAESAWTRCPYYGGSVRVLDGRLFYAIEIRAKGRPHGMVSVSELEVGSPSLLSPLRSEVRYVLRSVRDMDTFVRDLFR
jgi:hypothetical protein